MDVYHNFYLKFLSSLDRRKLSFDQMINDKLFLFFYHLLNQTQKYNLTGYNTIDDCIDFHLLDVLVMNSKIDSSSIRNMIDVGSGGGIPGIILSIFNKDISILLLESSKKKVLFLQMVIDRLSLENCSIVNERAEIAGCSKEFREKFDFATARAIGSLSLTLELTAPFSRLGGTILLPRGNQSSRLATKDYYQKTLGIILRDRLEYSLPRRDKKHRLLFFEKKKFTEKIYPRRFNQIKKRPL